MMKTLFTMCFGVTMAIIAQGQTLDVLLSLDKPAFNYSVAMTLNPERFTEFSTWCQQAVDRRAEIANGQWRNLEIYTAAQEAYIQHSADRREVLRRLLDDAIEMNPDAFPLRVLSASWLIREAWLHRGDTRASEVSAEGWANFRTYLERGWEKAQDAIGYEVTDPSIYHEMVVIAMGLGMERDVIYDIAKKAIVSSPEFLEIHAAVAYAFLPRWLGGANTSASRLGAAWSALVRTVTPGQRDPTAMLWDYAEWAADRTRDDVGDCAYAVIVHTILHHERDDALAWSIDVPRFVDAVAELESAFGASDRLLNAAVKFVCMKGEKELADRLFAHLPDERIHRGIWPPELANAWRTWAAHGGIEPSRTELQEAAERGDFRRVRSLVANGEADVNAPNSIGDTALVLAAWRGHWDIALFLAESGANANIFREDLRPPLSFAVMAGRTDVVETLLRLGADPNVGSGTVSTPVLAQAARGGHSEIIDALLEAGADPNATGHDGYTALFMAINFDHRRVAMRLLELPDIDPSITNMMGITTLHVAAYRGWTGVIERLIEDDTVDVNARDMLGWSPLHSAAYTGSIRAARMLIAKGADPTLHNYSGQSAIDIARDQGYDELYRMLDGAE